MLMSIQAVQRVVHRRRVSARCFRYYAEPVRFVSQCPVLSLRAMRRDVEAQTRILTKLKPTP